ncbi:MAG: hypothetical protein KGL39_35610, partial [Patescibacteria group bacterium]|nr:hypothetical protein [Patescibacteria group bacterium]
MITCITPGLIATILAVAANPDRGSPRVAQAPSLSPSSSPVIPPAMQQHVGAEFRDPDRTVAICGERVSLELRVSGQPSDYTWSVLPPGTTGLKVSRDKSEADFTTRFPGTYTFFVAVAGSDGSVAQAFKTVELRQEIVPGAEPIMASPVTTKSAVTRELSPGEIIRQKTEAVRDPNKMASLAEIRSTLSNTAASIDGGLLVVPQGTTDYVGYLMEATRGQASLALGSSFGE